MVDVSSIPLADVIDTLEPSSEHEWRGSLKVDEADPFFFDHPLDHVPGMLLVEAFLRAVEQRTSALAVAGSSGSFFASTVDLEFESFCEKGIPAHVHLRGVDLDRGLWEARALQNRSLLARGIIVTSRYSGELPGPMEIEPASSPPLRVDRRLVHKSNECNVMIGCPVVRPDSLLEAAVFPSSTGRRWAGGGGNLFAPCELIEAGRQMSTLLMHSVEGIPMGSQFVLQRLTLTMSRPVHRLERVELFGRPEGSDRRESYGSGRVRASGEIVGRLHFRGRMMAPALYARMRGLTRERTAGRRQARPAEGSA